MVGEIPGFNPLLRRSPERKSQVAQSPECAIAVLKPVSQWMLNSRSESVTISSFRRIR